MKAFGDKESFVSILKIFHVGLESNMKWAELQKNSLIGGEDFANQENIPFDGEITSFGGQYC